MKGVIGTTVIFIVIAVLILGGIGGYFYMNQGSFESGGPEGDGGDPGDGDGGGHPGDGDGEGDSGDGGGHPGDGDEGVMEEGNETTTENVTVTETIDTTEGS